MDSEDLAGHKACAIQVEHRINDVGYLSHSAQRWSAAKARYLIRPYYLRPDGKVGHDAFAVIREMDKVAIGRVVLTNREHIFALEPLDRSLVGTMLPLDERGNLRSIGLHFPLP